MKKMLLLLLILTVFFACAKKDEDDTVVVDDTNAAVETAEEPVGSEEDLKKFYDFPGPIVNVNAAPGDPIWIAIPIGMEWDSLKFTQMDLDRIEGNEAVVTFVGEDIYVPAAFTASPDPVPGLSPGDPVIVSIYVTSAYGKIVEVIGDKAKVKFMWALELQEEEFGFEEIIKLSGNMEFGSPVAYKEGSDWNFAQLLYNDGSICWVAGFMGEPIQVNSSDVVSVNVNKIYNVGDRIAFKFGSGSFMAGEITEVKEGALIYTVQYESFDSSDDFEFAEITDILEGM